VEEEEEDYLDFEVEEKEANLVEDFVVVVAVENFF